MYDIEYKGMKIEYRIERKNVKNINLRVKADGTVAVSANNSVPKSVIDDFILQNADRILKAIRKINRKNSNIPTFESDTRIKLLGAEYALQVNESDKNYYSVGSSKILFFVRNSEVFENREAVYNMLLFDIASKVFPKLLKEQYNVFKGYCAEFPGLNIKFLKSQWGNCYAGRNLITLNARLAAYNENTIRYVINHEYCHFAHQNHSQDFYKLLSAVMPEWKQYRNELKK